MKKDDYNVGMNGEGADSNEANARFLTAPNSALSLSAVGENGRVRLSWNAIARATGYRRACAIVNSRVVI